jgi:glycosyltransferase involved in cell wall biosynthesis
VPAGDEDALADALARILSDRALAERLGDAGRERAHALFSMNACLERFERLYHALRTSTPSVKHAS